MYECMMNVCMYIYIYIYIYIFIYLCKEKGGGGTPVLNSRCSRASRRVAPGQQEAKRKTLVFSQFTMFLDIIGCALEELA